MRPTAVLLTYGTIRALRVDNQRRTCRERFALTTRSDFCTLGAIYTSSPCRRLRLSTDGQPHRRPKWFIVFI